MKSKYAMRGFTMIEMMIVVAIIGILAAIAIPSYVDFITRGALAEAHQGLGGFRVKMEQYYQDNRTYNGAGIGGCGAAGMEPTGTAPPLYPSKNFSHSCAITNGGQGYTATATGVGGRVTGFVFTVNEQNLRQTTAAPSGWLTATLPCFIVRKNACS
jgi:type IV pilus assembly protein PilE